MAYMSQEKKAKIAPVVKKILAKYKVKGSLAVNNHSTLVLNIKSGPIDFIANCGASATSGRAVDHLSVNEFHFKNHYTGKALKFLTEVIEAMNDGNHDRSDSHTDYFDVGWYINVNIGQWNKPYIVA